MATFPILVPQNSKGMAIAVQSGGFVMTGYTATLLLGLDTGSGTGTVVSLPLVVSGDGLSGTYTTVGGEFATPGLYDAQLKISLGATTLYSLRATQMLQIQAALG